MCMSGHLNGYAAGAPQATADVVASAFQPRTALGGDLISLPENKPGVGRNDHHEDDPDNQKRYDIKKTPQQSPHDQKDGPDGGHRIKSGLIGFFILRRNAQGIQMTPSHHLG